MVTVCRLAAGASLRCLSSAKRGRPGRCRRTWLTGYGPSSTGIDMTTLSRRSPYCIVGLGVSPRLVVAGAKRDWRGGGRLGAKLRLAAKQRRWWSGLADGWSRCYTEQCNRWSKTRAAAAAAGASRERRIVTAREERRGGGNSGEADRRCSRMEMDHGEGMCCAGLDSALVLLVGRDM